MVDNVSQAGNTPAPIQSDKLQQNFFPGSKMSGDQIHKFVSQWVNNILKTLHSEEARMKKANENLRKSEGTSNG